MRIRWLLAAAAAVATSAGADPPAPSSAVAQCGHVAELEAAKAALARGDRESALHHLEAADALLQRCEQEAIPAETQPEPEIQTG
jgi:hypothetical protein